MLGLSVGLHAIVLMIPLSLPPQPLKTFNLKPIRVVPRPPQSQSSPPSIPQPQPRKPSPAVSESRSSNPSSSTFPSVSSSPTTVQPSLVKLSAGIKPPQTPPSTQSKRRALQSEPPQPSPTPSSNPATAQIEFQSFITGVKAGDKFTTYSLLEILELFGQPGQVEVFFNSQGQQKPGILEFQVFADKSLEQVIQDIVQTELGDRQRFTLQKQEFAKNNILFTATKQGFTRYVHLLSLDAQSGTLLVIWDRPPAIISAWRVVMAV